MGRRNHSTVTDFILVGFSDVPELRYFLFLLFLCIFTISLFANMFLIILYRFSTNLHTPMYYFLANFSFLEICYILTIKPKMLANILFDDKTITLCGCALQMFFFLLLASTECYMLAAMAYDRYYAICQPLLYNMIMSRNTRLKLILGSWIIGLTVAVIQTPLTFYLPFCGPNKINHFTSHLIVVAIFYGSGSVMYLRPKSSYGTDVDKFLSLMYAIIAPLLNPFIYSLRNNDVKYAVRKMILQELRDPDIHELLAATTFP
ncbi:olfactory receptor 1020-like [Bufo gargarizans]|uniref:olfactory receptor 1020-like n=1 Tax=Bufo gargarizans TaxID=30331 RepID=UPI001CF3403D|nr:olfactory receptor 1020-like [Bufo gargarizans]